LSTNFTHILQGWITTLGLNLTLQEEWVRIAAHGFEFFLLGCITAGAIWIYRNPIMTALFRNVVVFIPFIDEGIQSFVPGRAFQWTDLLIDFAGLLLGMLVIVQCKKTRIKRNLEKI
jgi:VanZ family protein